MVPMSAAAIAPRTRSTTVNARMPTKTLAKISAIQPRILASQLTVDHPTPLLRLEAPANHAADAGSRIETRYPFLLDVPSTPGRLQRRRSLCAQDEIQVCTNLEKLHVRHVPLIPLESKEPATFGCLRDLLHRDGDHGRLAWIPAILGQAEVISRLSSCVRSSSQGTACSYCSINCLNSSGCPLSRVCAMAGAMNRHSGNDPAEHRASSTSLPPTGSMSISALR